MGRTEPCEFVRRGLPQAKYGLLVSLCDNKHSSSHYWTSGKILCANWSKTYKSNYLASKATTTKPAIVHRAPQRIKELLLPWSDGESTASLQCKTITPVFTQWDNVLASPSSPFSLTLMCIPVCTLCFRVILHGNKSLKLQNHTWHLTRFWPWLKVKFWFGVINSHLPTGRLFLISRCCFVHYAH